MGWYPDVGGTVVIVEGNSTGWRSDGYTGGMMDRRTFLWSSGGGLGGVALAWLLGRDRLLADEPSEASPLLAHRARQPDADLNGGLHHRARAKRVVQLFMSGAASQCDTFDYKPELIAAPRPEVRPRRQGRAVPEQPRARA